MKKFSSTSEYIRSAPKDVQKILKKIRHTILETVVAEESLSYGMPAFKLNGRPLCYFAFFKHHIGFYPIPSSVKAFQKDLRGYKKGKGSVQFPLDKPIPFTLIKKIVKFRRREISELTKK